MKREDFKQIIKLRSVWKIDKRKGNYKLPNGSFLSEYVMDLVLSQMKLDSLGIMKDGDLCLCINGEWNADIKDFNDYTLMPAFKESETCKFYDMEKRIENIVHEIIE